MNPFLTAAMQFNQNSRNRSVENSKEQVKELILTVTNWMKNKQPDDIVTKLAGGDFPTNVGDAIYTLYNSYGLKLDPKTCSVVKK